MSKKKYFTDEERRLAKNKFATELRRAAGIKRKEALPDDLRIAADRASKRKYREANKDHLNALAKVSRAKQREAGKGSYETYLERMTPERKAAFVEQKKKYREENRQQIRERQRASYIDNVYHHIWTGLKNKSKRLGLPFNLDESDLVEPETCPVLGTKLERVPGRERTDNSPSVDRLIPSLGYVKGNIVIVSYRANRIKNDATLVELRKVAAYYELKFESSGLDLLRLMEQQGYANAN